MISKLLDFVAPESCLECNIEGSIWCDCCRLQYESLPSRCFLCHTMTNNFEVCKNCKKTIKLNSVYVYGEYKDINKQLIQLLKFDCKRHVAISLAKAMSDTLPYFSDRVCLVPVPSVSSHVRQRGFDQTAKLAKELSKQTGLRVDNVLVRTNNIRQVGASKVLRKKQIKGAFRCKSTSVDRIPQHVILVDDVVTTGATLSEASKTLKQAGVKAVDAVVFCYS